MTTATLRPNATVSNNGTVTGASAHAATSDDSDASYITFIESGGSFQTAILDLGTSSLPSGALVKQVRARSRTSSSTGSATTYFAVSVGSNAPLVSRTLTYVGTTIVDVSSAYAPTDLVGIELSGSTLTVQEAVDALRITLSGTSGSIRHYEGYVDVVYVAIPVVTVTAVSPDPYTDSTLVPIAWTNTLDSDGGSQTRYEIKVFDETTYGVGFSGLDPDTDTPYYESGEVVSSALTANVGPLETGDTYRVAVRTAQTVNGASHWSDWDTDDFDVSVTTTDVDTVTATASSANGRIGVTVARDTGSAAWELIEVQRSIDSGTTWTDVRFATYVAASGDSFSVNDYEVPNGTAAIYRARATRLPSGPPITGSWVQSSAATWTSTTDCWLKSPTDSSLNTTFVLAERDPYRRSRRSGVFSPLGSAAHVVLSDSLSYRSGVLTVETQTSGEADSLFALVDGSETLMVQYPASMDIADKYIGVIGVDELFESEVSDVLWRLWSVEYAGVAAPADDTAGR